MHGKTIVARMAVGHQRHMLGDQVLGTCAVFHDTTVVCRTSEPLAACEGLDLAVGWSRLAGSCVDLDSLLTHAYQTKVPG